MATTFLDLVHEQLPDATRDEAEHILWEYTGFPAFWRGDPETECRAQLKCYATLPKHLFRVYDYRRLTGDDEDALSEQTGLSVSMVREHLREIAAHEQACGVQR